MKNHSLLIISIISCILGILIYAIHQEWIIIHVSRHTNHLMAPIITKKNISLFYWHDNQWKTEYETVLWHEKENNNIQTIITSWLSTMASEQYASKTVAVESVILAPNKHLYISFDRHPFAKELSIRDKLYWLEGLLKTLKHNNLNILWIHFLVHHKPLSDTHIDTTYAWPIDGFLHNTINP